MRKEDDDLDILIFLLKSFWKQSRTIKIIVAFLTLILMIAQFFSVTNIYELVISIICIIALVAFRFIKTRWGRFLEALLAFGLIVNCLVTIFIGAPFFGIFSEENVYKRDADKFQEGMVQALYQLSLDDYSGSLKCLQRIENYVPEEDLLDYYIWYMEIATYAKERKLAAEIGEKLEGMDLSYDDRSNYVIFKYLPLAKMVRLLNSGDFDSLREIAIQYQNTNEQFFVLFELTAICYGDDVNKNVDRIEELLSQYMFLQDSYEGLQTTKLDLLYNTALKMFEIDPKYALILFAEIFEESPSYFYETFLYIYPKEGNIMNVRWFSLQSLFNVRMIFDTGWYVLQESEIGELRSYLPKIKKLGYFLGSELMLEDMGIQDIEEGVYAEYELYNVIPLSEGEYFATYIKPVKNGDEEIEVLRIAEEAYFCMLNKVGDILNVSPIMIDDQVLSQEVLMNKLFMVETTKMDRKLLVEDIGGTGEYLTLNVLDLNNSTYESIKNVVIYHTSDFKFDGNDKYVANYEINNNVDANMDAKVGGKVSAEIDFLTNTVSSVYEYQDPAVEFYIEERNEELIFPLQNLDELNGKAIQSETFLEKIRQNDTPYYDYSIIQRSYYELLETLQCKLSAITIGYDIGTEEAADFFYYVKREDDGIKLLGVYEIVNDKLRRVY